MIDWNSIERTALSRYEEKLRQTLQSPLNHAEGDVFVHTQMVCDALEQMPEYQVLNERQKHLLFVAALLHPTDRRELAFRAPPACRAAVVSTYPASCSLLVLVFLNHFSQHPFRPEEDGRRCVLLDAQLAGYLLVRYLLEDEEVEHRSVVCRQPPYHLQEHVGWQVANVGLFVLVVGYIGDFKSPPAGVGL